MFKCAPMQAHEFGVHAWQIPANSVMKHNGIRVNATAIDIIALNKYEVRLSIHTYVTCMLYIYE